MLLIPIAQENATVRRTPWVSYALIALSVAIFILVALITPATHAQLRDRLQAMVEYAAERPYLEIPESLARYTGPEFHQYIEAQRQQLDPETLPDREVIALH